MIHTHLIYYTVLRGKCVTQQANLSKINKIIKKYVLLTLINNELIIIEK